MTLPFFGLALPSASVLKTTPGMAAAYTSSESGAGPRTASLTLTVGRDGTWTIAGGPADGTTGTPLTGAWANGGPLPGIGDTHEALVTATAGAFDSNAMSSYVTLSSDKTAAISITDNLNDATPEVKTVTYTISVRLVGTTDPVCTQAGISWTATADRTS